VIVGGTAGTPGIGGAGGTSPATGLLQVLAGQPGGPGNIDGTGPAARFALLESVAFDPDDNRVFVLDGSVVRAIDGDTARVTTLPVTPAHALDALIVGQILYQRGVLYVAATVDVSDIPTITPISLNGTAGPPVTARIGGAFFGALVGWPSGDALFQVTNDGRLFRVNPTDGSVTMTTLAGFPPSSSVDSTVMTAAGTILVVVATALDDGSWSRQVLSIDVASGSVASVAALPSDVSTWVLDPYGEFVVGTDASSTQKVIALGSSVAPSFPLGVRLTRGPHGDLLIQRGFQISRWDRRSAAPTTWAGLDRVTGIERLGPAAQSVFSSAPISLATSGNVAYLPWALVTTNALWANPDGLATVDLQTNVVASLTTAHAADAATVIPAPGGGLYVLERNDCSIWLLSPDPAVPDLQIGPAWGACQSTGGNPLNPANHNFARPGLASFDGSLILVGNFTPGVTQIDPVAHTTVTRPFSDLAYSNKLQHLGTAGAAVAADGLLYVAAGGLLLRVDHGLGTATVVGPGGASVAADRNGHVYTTQTDTVLRLDLATGRIQTVVGTDGSKGIITGPLPGSLNHPQGLAVTDDGDLLIGNADEYTVLRAHFQ